MTAPNPEGDVVLVPREPTEAMLSAADCAGMAFSGSDLDSADMNRLVWKAMLSSAPAALQPSPDGVREKVAELIQRIVGNSGGFRPDDAEALVLADAVLAALPLVSERGLGWQPIETAPKDGSYIVALAAGADDRWTHLNGRAFVVRHEGVRENTGYDLGWAMFPGMGGAPTYWFSHWMPLPPLYARQQAATGRERGE